MRDNPIQFAVVREDPLVERALVDETGARRALLVASGGCTALSLAVERPELELALFDMNPAQLALVEDKRVALAGPDRRVFNVGSDDPAGLNARGNFESLFRGLRGLIEDLVIEPAALARAFEDRDALGPTVERMLASRFWPVAFELFFHDAILHAMFGPAATQHAAPGSYPGYFRAVLERGLRREDAFDNYFLHHVLRGGYVDRPAALPPYLRGAPRELPPLEATLGGLSEVQGLERFDVISLSNITDWMSAEEIADLAATLEGARPGAVTLFRQLNNATDLGAALGSGWERLDALGSRLHATDRSLFYDRVLVYRRRP